MLDVFHQSEIRLGPVAQQQLSDTNRYRDVLPG